MDCAEHRQTSLDFLAASEEEFTGGEHLQASEKLWGAAAHAVLAVAIERDWPIKSHRDLKNAAQRLTVETGDALFYGGFGIAEKFHTHFYHKVIADEELDDDKPFVHTFVHRTLALLNDAGTAGG